MREALALGLVILVFLIVVVFAAAHLRRKRIEREYRRGHGDYSKVRPPGRGWFG